MATNNFLNENLFSRFLEDVPRAAYFSLDKPMGQSPREKRFFQNQFQDIQNEYIGDLGRQIRSGQPPTLQWTDFLDKFPFSERYAAMPPQYRGDFPRQFSSPTRFLYNF
jgi:hypothetical protein